MLFTFESWHQNNDKQQRNPNLQALLSSRHNGLKKPNSFALILTQSFTILSCFTRLSKLRFRISVDITLVSDYLINLYYSIITRNYDVELINSVCVCMVQAI